MNNLEQLLAVFRTEMHAAVGAVRQDILKELRPGPGCDPNRQQRFEERLQAAEVESRRWRGLMCGLEPDENRLKSAGNTPAQRSDVPQKADIPTLKEVENDMRNVLALEEEHRLSLPRPGDGLHYLNGSPPFWRRPWPENWRVHKPWEFARVHNHQELTQRLKYPVLTEFDGDRDAYPQWQRLFYQTIHVQDMDDETKYGYLLRYVTNGVKQIIIDGLARSKSDYCFAVIRLERHYGARSWREDESAEMLNNFRPFPPYDLKRANEFLRKLEGYMSSEAGSSPDAARQTVMSAVRRVLPREWVESYYKYARSTKTQISPQTALDYLRQEIELKTELAPSRPLNPDLRRRTPVVRQPRKEPGSPRSQTTAAAGPNMRSPTPKAVTFVAQEDAGPLRCYCCRGNHHLKRCPQFQGGTNGERRQVLEDHGLCLVCFASDHLTQDCLVGRNCPSCGRRHSPWVHIPEDEDAGDAGPLFADEQPADEYEWMHEPGLSGEFLGEGFMAVDPEEEQEDHEGDPLYFAGAAIQQNEPADPSSGPRRSLRLAGQALPNYGRMHQGAPHAWPTGTGVSSSTRAEAASEPPTVRTSYPSRIVRARRGAYTPLPQSTASPTNYRMPAPRARGSPRRRGKPPGIPATPPRGGQRPVPRPLGLTFDTPANHPVVAAPQNPIVPAVPSPARPELTRPAARPQTTRADSVARTPTDDIKVGLQQAVINVQNPKTKAHMTINALIDSGANHTAISMRLADKLELEGTRSTL